MFETRKYMDYELAYKMFKKCEKLLEKGIDELDDYFEEVGDRRNGYTSYYGADYNTWVYIINENFDTEKEDDTWLDRCKGLRCNGEVEVLSYNGETDTLFINSSYDIQNRLNNLKEWATNHKYSEDDFEKEKKSLERVLDLIERN